MKKLLTAFVFVISAFTGLTFAPLIHAQTTDPKIEWATRVVALQQGPELDRLVEQLANSTTEDLLQNWRPKLLASVPKARQKQVTDELNTELKKYFDDVSLTIAGKVARVSSEVLVPAYMERFSLDELKEIGAFFESPTIKKYQLAAPELGNAFVKQLIEITRPEIAWRIDQFDTAAGRITGIKSGTKASSIATGVNDKSKSAVKK